MRRCAAPIGEAAARRLDQWRVRRPVPDLQLALGHPIDAPGRDHGVGVAVAAQSGQAGRGAQPVPGGAVGADEDLGIGGGDQGLP